MSKLGRLVAVLIPIALMTGAGLWLTTLGRQPSARVQFRLPHHMPAPVAKPVGIAPGGHWLADEATFARSTHARPGMLEFYQRFGSPLPTAKLAAVRKLGAVPVLQLNPRGIPVADIARGGWDRYLTSLGREIHQFGGRMYLSFAHEMNGKWETWGNGRTPAHVYVQAWRRIWNKVTDQGADPVWLWNINREGTGVAAAGPWWPGNAYVDVVGIDAYYRNPHQTFRQLLQHTLATVRHLTTAPVMLAETGAAPGPAQAGHILQLFNGVRRKVIIGFIWFNMNAKEQWRLNGDRQGLEAMRQGITGLLHNQSG